MDGLEILVPAAGSGAGFVVVVAVCLRALVLEQQRRLTEVKAHARTQHQLDAELTARRESEAREARATAALERAAERNARHEEHIAYLTARVRDLGGSL